MEIKKNEFEKVNTYANSTIIEPCFIANDVVIEGSTIGPHVSIGKGSKIINSQISNSIIQENTQIHNISFSNSMIGNHVTIDGNSKSYSIGDYSTIQS